ncbi:MAG TPA: hypothetical protein EYO61_01310 [Campylobacterales bacterium]|nr:hypothetical protein [Campylobacterales bacterium]HIO70481.1 hypothetical protein [Campylobacterales bacterium]
MTKLLQTIVILFILNGCARHLGQFTALSSFNVRNLKYSKDDNTKVRTSGEACARSIFGLPISQQDDLLQRATDNAIRNGQDEGVDGDLLVNVRIKESSVNFLFYTSFCYEIEADLVKVED